VQPINDTLPRSLTRLCPRHDRRSASECGRGLTCIAAKQITIFIHTACLH